MANPNSEIWGAPSSWVYSNMSYGLETTVAKLANADKPKCKNFGSTPYDDYQQTLFSAVQHNFIALNTPLDRSLCPCGIAPEVSPWAKLAIFNESNNLSTTPSRTIEVNDANTNWFFCNRRGSDNNAFYYTRDYTYSNDGGLKYQQFAPKAATTSMIYNQCLRIAPYMSYGIKSLLLSIQVRCISHSAPNPITGTFWVSLNDWKNNYPTYDICGLRFFVRNCTAINNTTLALTYNNDIVQTGGYKSGNIAVYQTIKVLNNGENVDTEFLTLSMSDRADGRTGTIFDVSPSIYNWGDGRNNRPVYPCWNYFTGQTMNVYKPSSDPQAYYFYKIPYSQDTYDKIMKIAACFGCYFTPTNRYQFAYDMLDNDLYLTVLDENGVAHGEYTNGSNNANNSLYSKNTIREIDYNPDAPTPHNRYYDHTDLPTSGGSALNWYSDKTTGTLEPHMNLGNLFQAIADIADNPNNQQFLFQEPIKNILDYRRILLTQPWGDRPAGATEVIPLGSFTTAGSQYPFTGYKDFPRFRRVTLGSFSFDREFNNFLDFEPYTQAILYVPYCGVKQLPMNIFAGHTVNIYMNADNTSGVLQVLIFVDNIEWGTLSGMASEELPLVGETALTAANTKRELAYQQGQVEWQKLIGVLGSLAGASISASQQNAAGVLAQGLSAAYKNYYYRDQQVELQYQINHTKPEPLTIQKGDSSIDKMNVQYPFIMIQSPVIIGGDTPEKINAIKQAFGHTKGFKCCETGVIGDFSGLTKCSTANLNGISCTYTEKKMIMEALQEGVIL